MNSNRLTALLLLSAAFASTPLSATIDHAHNGVSDLWTALYPTAGAPEADPDGDGASTLAEALAGTDPLSAGSRLASMPAHDPAGNLVLCWQGVAGKHYTIKSSTDLSTWTALPETFTGTGEPFSPVVVAAGAPSSARQFWQVSVSDADTDSDDLNDWEEAQLGTDPLTATPPVLTTQPQGVSVTVGQTATFTVAAVGDAPFSYQWTQNGSPITGAKFTSYTTPITTLAESGTQFVVIVTDAAGRHTTSAGATLAVAQGAHRSQHYVDPVNGSDQGDGSSASPWKSLQTVVNTHVATQNWASLPYADGRSLIPVNAGAAVQAGDTIWLRSGDHGALVIRSAYNSAPITIAAEAGSVPRLSNVLVQSAQHWILRGFSVSPSYAATYGAKTIVTVENQNFRGPASDVEIDGFEIFSIPDESIWTLASDWDTKAADAISADAARAVVRNCRIRNVDFGISMAGRGSRVERNVIDAFSGDGMRGNGDDEVFEYNLVKNLRIVNDNHADAFQSWSTGPAGNVGGGVVKNVTFRGNVLIAYEDRSSPFFGAFQGIGCFDGLYEGWIVENNVVMSEHWHGISFYGARNVRIVNNTLIDLDTTDNMKPWLLVIAHKKGEPSRNCVVRNNLTPLLDVTADAANGIVVDHNLVLPSNVAGYFVDLAHNNARLAAGSPAIDQGSAALAPALDADETPRPAGATVDVGAYEYAP